MTAGSPKRVPTVPPKVAIAQYAPRDAVQQLLPKPAEKPPTRSSLDVDFKVRRSLGQYGLGVEGEHRSRTDELFGKHGERLIMPAWEKMDRFRADFAKASVPQNGAPLEAEHSKLSSEKSQKVYVANSSSCKTGPLATPNSVLNGLQHKIDDMNRSRRGPPGIGDRAPPSVSPPRKQKSPTKLRPPGIAPTGNFPPTHHTGLTPPGTPPPHLHVKVPKATEGRAAQRLYVGQHPGGYPMERAKGYGMENALPKRKPADSRPLTSESSYTQHFTRTVVRPSQSPKAPPQPPPPQPPSTHEHVKNKFHDLLRPSTADLMLKSGEEGLSPKRRSPRFEGVPAMSAGATDITPMPRHGVHHSAGSKVPTPHQTPDVEFPVSRDHPDLGGEDPLPPVQPPPHDRASSRPGMLQRLSNGNRGPSAQEEPEGDRPDYAMRGRRTRNFTDGSPAAVHGSGELSPTKSRASRASPALDSPRGGASPTKSMRASPSMGHLRASPEHPLEPKADGRSPSPTSRANLRLMATEQGTSQASAWDPNATGETVDSIPAGTVTTYGDGTLGTMVCKKPLSSPIHDTTNLAHKKRIPAVFPSPDTPQEPAITPNSRLSRALSKELSTSTNVNMANPLSTRHRHSPTPTLAMSGKPDLKGAMASVTEDRPVTPLIASLQRSLPSSQRSDETRPRTPSKTVVGRPNHPRNYLTPPGSNHTATRLQAPAFPSGDMPAGRPTTGGVKAIIPATPSSFVSRPGTSGVFNHAPGGGMSVAPGRGSQVLNIETGDEYELTELPDLMALLGHDQELSAAPSEVASLQTIYQTLADVLVASARKGMLDTEGTAMLTSRMKELAQKLKQVSDNARKLSKLRRYAVAENVPVKNWIARNDSSNHESSNNDADSAVVAVELEQKTSDLVQEQVESCRILARQVKAGLETVLQLGHAAGALSSPDKVPSALEMLEPGYNDSEPEIEPEWLTARTPGLLEADE